VVNKKIKVISFIPLRKGDTALRIRNYVGAVLKNRGYEVEYLSVAGALPPYVYSRDYSRPCVKGKRLECAKPSYYYFIAGLVLALIYLAKKDNASLLLFGSSEDSVGPYRLFTMPSFDREKFGKFFEEMKAVLSMVSDFPHNGFDVSRHVDRVFTRRFGKGKEWDAVIKNLELSLTKNTRRVEITAKGTENYSLNIPPVTFKGYLVKEVESAFIVPPFMLGSELLDPEVRNLTLKDINYRIYFIREFVVIPLEDGEVSIKIKNIGYLFRAPWGEKEYLGEPLEISGGTAFIYQAVKKEGYEEALLYFNSLLGKVINESRYLYVRTAPDTPFIHTKRDSITKGFVLQKHEIGRFYTVLDRVFGNIKDKYVFTVQYPLTPAQLFLLEGNVKKKGRGYVASHGTTFMAYLSQDFWVQRASLIPVIFLAEGVFSSESTRHFLAKTKNPIADRKTVFVKRNGYVFPFARNVLLVETAMRTASMLGSHEFDYPPTEEIKRP
jgi:hypothetical protein